MKIGFIGTGNMTEALASRWVGTHDVLIGGRNLDKAKALAAQLGANVAAGSEKDAATFGEVVVLATAHEAVFDAMAAAGGPSAFAGKVLIDINNPIVDFQKGDFLVKSYGGESLSEAIAAYAPEMLVVKAFNMCQAQVWKMDPPLFDGRPLTVLYCGDDAGAKQTVSALIAELGCEPVDVGELRYARLLEAAAAIVIKFLFSGRDPRTVLNFIQPESKPIS
jgi:8-hydroxy-5-deazaflavin:NADPH oxidoreductase